jgi:hypothetical protein
MQWAGGAPQGLLGLTSAVGFADGSRDGHRLDQCVFGMLREEWLARQRGRLLSHRERQPARAVGATVVQATGQQAWIAAVRVHRPEPGRGAGFGAAEGDPAAVR